MRVQFFKKLFLTVLSLSLAVTGVHGAASFYYGVTGTDEVSAALQPDYTYQGIDVSKWQEDIDWAQVASDKNVEFVIIRCGYGSNTETHDDVKWEEYASACEQYGIPYGVYLYSYATSSAMIDSEVNHIKRLLKGHTPSLPIYLDMEEKTVTDTCSASQLSAMAKRFCKKMDNAGFRCGVYASAYYWYAYLDKFAEEDTHYHWVAQYNTPYCAYANEEIVEDFGKSWAFFKDYHYYETWQYASTGSVAGISGNVDMNYWYGSMDLIASTTSANTASGVKLTWSSTPQADYYYIYRKDEDASSYEKVDYVDASTLSYVDDSAEPGALYDYKIKLRTGSGFTEAGPRSTILRLENPVISKVANYDKGMKVAWDETDGADGYYIYRKTSQDGTWEKLDKVEDGSTVSYKDTTVKAGKRYYYTVKAYSDEGYSSSKDADGSSYYRLATPAMDEISNKSYGMYIAWDDVAKASGYNIYRKSKADGTYELIAQVEGRENTEYRDKSVAFGNGKNYYYTVRAYITKGSRNYYSAQNAEGLYYYRLTAPYLTKAVKKSKYNKVVWDENEKAGGYIVYRKTKKSGSWKKVAVIDDSETAYYKDTDVKKGKTYYYTVRAYKVKNGTKYVSKYDTTGLKVKR